MRTDDFVPPWEDFKVSGTGKLFIKKQEGYSAEVYRDGEHNRAGGWGHSTMLPIGSKWPKKYWETCFSRDIQAVENCLRRNVKVAMTQGQVDALASLVFNIGCGSFERSTLLKRLNASDYVAAAAEFARWNKSDDQVNLALVARRAAEQELFAS